MRNFLTFFSLTVAAGAASLLPLFFYLSIAGEYLTAEEIVKRQTGEDEVIFGSAIRNGNAYKLEALARLEPRIVSLGSSRVMQFRQHSFNEKFLNLGGLMSSIHDGHKIVDSIIAAKPHTVIIGADIWWFNESFQRPRAYKSTKPKLYTPNLQAPDLYQLISYLVDGKLSFNISNRHIGLSGKKGDGYGNDGFRHYTTKLIGTGGHSKLQFADTFSRIDRGTRRFQYGTKSNQQHIKNFNDLVSKLEHASINVVVFFPPFAHAVNNKMDSLRGKYSYVEDLKNQLYLNGIDFFDYTHADLIGSTDCEFLDGFHGGEITYARILKDMSIKTRIIQGITNIHAIDKLINKHSGLAAARREFPNGGYEIDFLGLGCSKPKFPTDR